MISTIRMDPAKFPSLHPNLTEGANVAQQEPGVWRLTIPAGPPGKYRLAQLDDYEGIPRRSFHWRAPVRMELRARASHPTIPGTWGFGLWNDPFGMAVLRGVEMLRLPALPNAAWFFFASPPNYLSLQDNLPAQGGLAATFRSPRWPGPVLALGAPILPLMFYPPAVRGLRRLGSYIVQQESVQISQGVTEWHTYGLEWKHDRVRGWVDERTILDTAASPHGPLGLVLWIDNQYAAIPPSGRIRFGTLENPESAWVEIADLSVDSGNG